MDMVAWIWLNKEINDAKDIVSLAGQLDQFKAISPHLSLVEWLSWIAMNYSISRSPVNM